MRGLGGYAWDQAVSSRIVGVRKRARSGTGFSPRARSAALIRTANKEFPPSSKKSSSRPTGGVEDGLPDLPEGVGEGGVTRAVRLRGGPCGGGGGADRGGQTGRVQLAVGRQREGVEGRDRGRDHVLGEDARGTLAQALEVGGGGAARRDHVGVEAGRGRVGGVVAVHHHGGGGDGRVLQEYGADLVELDAEAADLYLAVDSAEVLQPPVGAQPRSPLRYVRARASGAYGSGRKRSAVSSGRLRYPAATPAPPTRISPVTPGGTRRPRSSVTYRCQPGRAGPTEREP